jgi:hypothetical protein
MDILSKVKDIPEKGWDYPPSELSYRSIAISLKNAGLSESEIIDILTTCYFSAVDDYKYKKL